MSKFDVRRVLVIMMTASLVGALGVSPVTANADTGGLVSDQTNVKTIGDQRMSRNGLGSMPDNPTQPLPDKVSAVTPDDAAVVAPTLATKKDGTTVNLSTGATVTDSKIVGTSTQPPDPLGKTDGKRFIPVQAGEVKKAVRANGGEVDVATGGKDAGSQSVPRVRNIALQNNGYGAYWGSYNGTPAFFEAGGNLFAQQAKGVIDVSQWQGDIDWQAVKNSGVEGAIIRISYGWGNDYDPKAIRNINECKRLGIPFGVYIYSYAYDSAGAAAEGQDVVAKLRGAGVSPSDLSYPVFYDLEHWSWTGHAPPSSPWAYDSIVNSWYSQLQAGGYNNLSIYSYTGYLNGPLNSGNIHSKTRWVASYGPRTGFGYSTNERGWQYADNGSIPGIGGSVDLNAFGNLSYSASWPWGHNTFTDISQHPQVSLSNGKYYISSAQRDTAGIDVPGASTADGTLLQLFGANHSDAQRYLFTAQNDGSYEIKNVASNKVLDVPGGQARAGKAIQQYAANGTAAQHWFLRESGQRGGLVIQSALGNFVLDLALGNTTDFTQLQLNNPTLSGSQQYFLSSVTQISTSRAQRISSVANSSQVLDIPSASDDDNVGVEVYSWDDTDAQKFNFHEIGNAIYEITNAGSGKAVEAAGAGYLNSTPIQQYAPNHTSAQRWMPRLNGNGSYSFFPECANKALDLPGGSTQNGTYLQLYNSNGSSAQQWRLEDATTNRDKINKLAAQHKTDLADGTYTFISSTVQNKVMEVAGGSHEDGGKVQLYDLNNTYAQAWQVSHDADGYITLTNQASGKVLDVNGGVARLSAGVQQYTSNGSWAQKWIALKSGDHYTLMSGINRSYVLDVAGGSTMNGAVVQLYSNNGTSAQQWRPVAAKTPRTALNALAAAHKTDLADGKYVFATKNAYKQVLDVVSGSHSDGAVVQLYEENNSGAQIWQVSHDSMGYVTLTNSGSGKVLDVSGGVATLNARVQQFSSNGTWAQKWVAVKNGDHCTLISAIDSDYVLDVAGGSSKNGATVQLYYSNGSNAQHWQGKALSR